LAHLSNDSSRNIGERITVVVLAVYLSFHVLGVTDVRLALLYGKLSVSSVLDLLKELVPRVPFFAVEELLLGDWVSLRSSCSNYGVACVASIIFAAGAFWAGAAAAKQSAIGTVCRPTVQLESRPTERMSGHLSGLSVSSSLFIAAAPAPTLRRPFGA